MQVWRVTIRPVHYHHKVTALEYAASQGAEFKVDRGQLGIFYRAVFKRRPTFPPAPSGVEVKGWTFLEGIEGSGEVFNPTA